MEEKNNDRVIGMKCNWKIAEKKKKQKEGQELFWTWFCERQEESKEWKTNYTRSYMVLVEVFRSYLNLKEWKCRSGASNDGECG